MFQPTKILMMLSITLIVGYPSITISSEESYDSPAGRWKTKWQNNTRWKPSSLTFNNEKTAFYKGGRVVFFAASDQGKWDGYWIGKKKGKCLEKKEGSSNWGKATFQFNETYDKFKGSWDFCGKGLAYGWNGKR